MERKKNARRPHKRSVERDRTVGRVLARTMRDVPVSLLITDAEGRILYVNRAFERLTGFPAGEILGKTPAVVRSGCMTLAFYQSLGAAIQAGQSWRGEIVNRRKGGDLYTAELSITPTRDASGRIAYFTGIHRDVTQEREVQTGLERSAREAETLRAEQNELVSSLGLALTGPLAEIAESAAQIMRSTPEREELIRGPGEAIGAAVATLQQRLAKLLDLGRTGLGHGPLARVALGECMEAVAQELARLRQESPAMPVVIVTGNGKERLAVQAMRLGAVDCITASRTDERGIPHVGELLGRRVWEGRRVPE